MWTKFKAIILILCLLIVSYIFIYVLIGKSVYAQIPFGGILTPPQVCLNGFLVYVGPPVGGAFMFIIPPVGVFVAGLAGPVLVPCMIPSPVGPVPSGFGLPVILFGSG